VSLVGADPVGGDGQPGERPRQQLGLSRVEIERSGREPVQRFEIVHECSTGRYADRVPERALQLRRRLAVVPRDGRVQRAAGAPLRHADECRDFAVERIRKLRRNLPMAIGRWNVAVGPLRHSHVEVAAELFAQLADIVQRHQLHEQRAQ